MFAVSGWNLASGPATQVDNSAKKKKTSKKKKDKSTGINSIPVAKNRLTAPEEFEKPKSSRSGGTVVTKDNVLALYEKVIEGRSTPSGKKRRRGGKMNKTEDGGVRKKRSREDDAEGQPVDAEAEQPKKKTKKEKMREKEAAATTATAGVSPTAATKATPADIAAAHPSAPATTISSLPALTPLQAKMRQKLSSARFRHINETLYTTPSSASFDLFKQQPEMYQEYHTGFRRQVEVWPENPVDIFISSLESRSRINFQRGHTKKHLPASTALLPLPRAQDTGVCAVADLGCGDAKIAATFNHDKKKQKEKIKILSFDLQASTPDVTIADIANLPLENESVDIAIFCLALMGTNFLSFIDEAFRILQWRGELWVAEIKSRFHQKAGADEADPEAELVEGEAGRKRDEEAYKAFVEALQKRGFQLRGTVDASNRMFVGMEFVKMPERERRIAEDEEEAATGKKSGKMERGKKKKAKFIEDSEMKEEQILKPCVYKLR